MKILVFAHRLEIGGTQTIAIDLAAAVRGLGIDPVLYAAAGPAVGGAESKGLRVIEGLDAKRHPSLARIRHLAHTIRAERPDLVHAWDWPQVVDALYATSMARRPPVLATSMSSGVNSNFARTVAATFGVEALVDQARPGWRAPVFLLEPPVDVDADRPGARGADYDDLVATHDLDPTACRVVIVSRLVRYQKLESLERAIDATGSLAADRAVQLVIGGGGPEAPALRARADAVNQRLGRRVVVLVGELLDPRPAYNSADIVLGMGSSALRGMSFSKPVVVVGERGFSRILDEESAPAFLHAGWYGLAGGVRTVDPLVEQIRRLVDDASLRARLGALGRSIVEERFGVRVIAPALVDMYASAAKHSPPILGSIAEGLRVGAMTAGSPARATLKKALSRARRAR